MIRIYEYLRMGTSRAPRLRRGFGGQARRVIRGDPQGLTCLRVVTHRQAPCGVALSFTSSVESQKSKVKNCASGFTILFAVLIGSLLFSLGLAIAHLSLREIVLASAGRESEHTFFDADTGIECALYWDIKVGNTQPVFLSSSAGVETRRTSIACGKTVVPVGYELAKDDTSATSTFMLSLASRGCAYVSVGKTTSGSTVIESRGRNDCDETRVNPARVERAIRVRY